MSRCLAPSMDEGEIGFGQEKGLAAVLEGLSWHNFRGQGLNRIVWLMAKANNLAMRQQSFID